MAQTSWRPFAFFSQTLLPAPPTSEPPAAVCALGDGGLVVADGAGACKVFNSEMKPRANFTALGVRHLVQPRDSPLVISVGYETEAGVSRAILRVWKVGGAGGELPPEGELQCARALRVFGAIPSDPLVTSCCVADDVSQIALGLDDGVVVLLRTTDLVRERFVRFKPLATLLQPAAGSAQAAAAPPTGASPVTGVHFCCAQGGRTPTDLWVLTADSVRCISGAGLRTESSRTLAEGSDGSGGAPAGCACVSSEGDLVLGRLEAIYMYNVDERGPCFAFHGAKSRLLWHRALLVVVTGEGGAEPASGSGAGAATGTVQHGVRIYDLKNKYIACSLSLGCSLQWIESMRERLLLGTSDGRLIALSEKDWAPKLELLYRKGLYPTALSLAHSEGRDEVEILKIHREYALHLHAKADYAGAAEQFIHTIGHTQPSFVISKYLEGDRIRHLARYLTALHADPRRLAAAEHTTLLLRCLVQLRDAEALESFVSTACADPLSCVHAPAAVAVLRESGFASLAVRLAEGRGEADLLLRLLLGDTQEYSEMMGWLRLSARFADGGGHLSHRYSRGLELISAMSPARAVVALKRWGRDLLANVPEPTIQQLLRVCAATQASHPAPAAAGMSTALTPARLASGTSQGLGHGGGRGDEAVDPSLATVELCIGLLSRDPDDPRLPGSHLRDFLETLVARPPQPVVVANTLLELYLAAATAEAAVSRWSTAAPPPGTAGPAVPAPRADPLSTAEALDRAESLLHRPSVNLDLDQALLLCHQFKWGGGLVLIYEKLGTYVEITACDLGEVYL